jgi:hypothetical protein
MKIARKEEIEAFLEDCRKVLECATCSFYLATANRQENRETLLALGYNNNNVIEEIKSLTIENYFEGPSPDKKYKALSWKFGKFINGKEVHIKLQVSRFNDPGDEIRTVICISFHFAKLAMLYPYKK